jgi:hypothetical protein
MIDLVADITGDICADPKCSDRASLRIKIAAPGWNDPNHLVARRVLFWSDATSVTEEARSS